MLDESPNLKLQLLNIPRDLGFFLFTESKQDFDSLDSLVKSVTSQNPDLSLVKPKTTTLNVAGVPARRFVVEQNVDGINIKYMYTFLDLPDEYCILLFWAKTSRFADHEAEFMAICDSVVRTP